MVMMCATCGFAGVQHYNEIKDISICEFLPPHLVIYVDLPAEEVQKKLKQSAKVEAHVLLNHGRHFAGYRLSVSLEQQKIKRKPPHSIDHR